jgi:hypothetical protein
MYQKQHGHQQWAMFYLGTEVLTVDESERWRDGDKSHALESISQEHL